ncbi:trans-sialidase [Trypanosoma conorhini]|uniref:Trans-sialidase n=1 Tax=Trypanosoma conorhini TaxID=83891 RepID=A0A3R7JZY7_9TRYP|nr:trans-sialidase [Trypanosoma conorhini]RNE98163.1 trans-sialidase [Trypanosoma conorhini]
MPRHLFSSAVLLLLFFICCGSQSVQADEPVAVNAVDPVEGTTLLSDAKWEYIKSTEGSLSSLRVPSLVKVGEDVFAVAGAWCKKTDGSGFAGIASTHLKEPETAAATEVSATDASSFATQLLKKGEEATDVMWPTTIVRGTDVYVLLGNYSRAEPTAETPGTDGWNLLMVKGTVTGSSEAKKLTWSETHAVKPQSAGDHDSLTRLVGGGGSGAVLKDGTLVFPMQAIDKEKKSALLTMRLTESKKKWELLSVATEVSCRDPSIVEWGDDGSLLMVASCEGGCYDVFILAADGRQWYRVFASIACVWGNTHAGKGFHVRTGLITADIEGRKVVLLTAPVYSGEASVVTGRLHLWVTDMQRVHDVGPASAADHNAVASSLLYKNDTKEELTLLYEKVSGDYYDLVSLRLTEQLQRVHQVVRRWTALDEALQSCTSTGSGEPQKTEGSCKGSVPTEGLVGLLSGTLDQTAWVDEYLGVNATVTNEAVTATKASNGLQFKGAGAGAQWPVGKLGQNQPYYFANTAFTLVATVTIHAVPADGSSPLPLLGARMNDGANTVLFGLAYTKDKRWSFTLHSNTSDGSAVTWEPGTAYRVAVTRDWNAWVVYVDGSVVDEGNYDGPLLVSAMVSHFYFGAEAKDGATESVDVTVADVLLYNRALGGDEIRQLKDGAVTIPRPAAAGEAKKPETDSLTPGGSGVKANFPALAPGENAVDGALPKDPQPASVGAGTGTPPSQKPARSQAPSAPKGPADSEGDALRQGSGAQTLPPPPSGRTHGATHAGDGADASHAGQAPNEAEERQKESKEQSGDAASGSPPDLAAAAASKTNTPAGLGGDGTAAAEPENEGEGETPGPEKKDAAPEAVLSSDGSPPARSDADQPPASNTTGTFLPGNVSAAFKNMTGLRPSEGDSDGAVRGCVSRLLLLVLLGLWSTTALR